MSENTCSNCGLPIYPDALHACVGTTHTYSEPNFPVQQIRLFPTFEPLVYTQTQADERTRAAIRDLIDERDSLLEDLDCALDEIEELREDLDAVCGDLKLIVEREKEAEPEFVGGSNLFEYKIINRFSVFGNEYVVTLNGYIYKIVECGDKDNILYELVTRL